MQPSLAHSLSVLWPSRSHSGTEQIPFPAWLWPPVHTEIREEVRGGRGRPQGESLLFTRLPCTWSHLFPLPTQLYQPSLSCALSIPSPAACPQIHDDQVTPTVGSISPGSQHLFWLPLPQFEHLFGLELFEPSLRSANNPVGEKQRSESSGRFKMGAGNWRRSAT